MDDSNNLIVTVAQADGTSKSGSVALSGGKDIDVATIKVNIFSTKIKLNSGDNYNATNNPSKMYYAIAKNTKSKDLRYSFEDRQFIHYESDISTGISDSTSGSYFNVHNYLELSALDTWLSSLVGSRLIDCSSDKISYTKPTKLYLVMSQVNYIGIWNSHSSSLTNYIVGESSERISVDVTVDDNGIITNIGTRSAYVKFHIPNGMVKYVESGRPSSNLADRISWSAQDITVSLYPDTISSSCRGTVMLNG